MLNIFAAGKGRGWRKERREEEEEERDRERGGRERFVKLRRTFHFDCDCDARFAARVKSVAQTIDKLIDKLTKLPREGEEREREREWGMRGRERKRAERGGGHTGCFPCKLQGNQLLIKML